MATSSEFFDWLDGLYAFDSGFTDSGINDNEIKDEVIAILKSEKSIELISVYIVKYFLTVEKRKAGYGIEDIESFIEWLSDKFDYQI